MEQELLTHPEHLSSPPVFSEIRVVQSLDFCVVFCRSLFVSFVWPLYFMSFFNLQLLVTPLVSSNFCYSKLKLLHKENVIKN